MTTPDRLPSRAEDIDADWLCAALAERHPGVRVAAVELIFGGWLDSRKLNRLNILKDRVYKHDVSGFDENAARQIKTLL